MKKALPLIVVVLILGLLAWYFTSGPGAQNPNNNTSTASSSTNSASSPTESSTAIGSTASSHGSTSIELGDENEDNEGLEDAEVKPATEVYKNAEEALQAVKAAAKSYDDSVLEQFTEPAPNCSWCDSFYAAVTDTLNQPETSADEKSYLAEILAISGRVDNLKTLVEAIRSAAKPEDAEVYAEALELTTGKDDATNYLGSQLAGASDNLRESLVAALTNQSSKSAAEILYKNTVERGDADGYYSQGIGLGEFIPDEQSMPYLQELMLKRDQYSHLATKALLNGGVDGVRVVLDSLQNSKDPDFDRKMLKDAPDHVNYDEETEALLKKRLETAKQPAEREFIEQALQSFNADGGEEGDVSTEEEDDSPPAE